MPGASLPGISRASGPVPVPADVEIYLNHTPTMNTPWFDPNLAWIPGTVIGIIGGLFGGTIGILMPLSRLKKRLLGIRYIKTAYILLLGWSVAMLLAGITALISGQPYGVWYGLGLAGFIGVIVFGSLFPLIFLLPKQIEAEWKAQNG